MLGAWSRWLIGSGLREVDYGQKLYNLVCRGEYMPSKREFFDMHVRGNVELSRGCYYSRSITLTVIFHDFFFNPFQ